jgi:surface protein
MKKLPFLFLFISLFGYSQTQITDDNFQEAINTCLTTNPVDGMCSDSVYGAMPDWDVSQVTNMTGLFRDATNFNGDISSWDVSSVTNMSYMFRDASSFNQDISVWDVSSVTNMRNIFQNATSFNQPLNNWDTSSVTNMQAMFNNASVFNQSLNDWDTSNVVNMIKVFYAASVFNGDISNWDTRNVSDMRSLFDGASTFNGDISNWDTSNVQNMSYMFWGASAFNQDIGFWDVSSVTNMAYMFSNAPSFNQDISNWNVSKVTDMTHMFADTPLFNQDIGGWDVSELMYASFMFYNSGVSTDNYDNILIGWSSQQLQPYVFFDADGLTYCSGALARQNLIDTYGWVIFDGGLASPTTQATSAVFGTETSSTLNLTGFTAPEGGADGYVIYVNDTDSFTAPTDGDELTANLSWSGSGQQVVYFGTSASSNITVTDLDPVTEYFFQIYAYNDCSGTETYETTGLAASDTSSQGVLTISGLTGDNKVYDGTTDATASGTPVLSGIVSDDDVVLGGTPVFTFASAELGTDITIITTGFIITGADSGNYTLAQPTLSADILTTLGVDDITDVKSSLKLHPNPAVDYIRILGLSEKANYIIYNVLGKQVAIGKVLNEEDIAIEGLSNGTYFIKIKNTKAIKFIKK